MESQLVMLQRLSRLQAGGPLAYTEAARMITEKTTAAASEAFSLGLALSTGRHPVLAVQRTIKSYRKKVAANHRRLRGK